MAIERMSEELNGYFEIPGLEEDLDIVQRLDDEPNDVGGLTAAELKATFDRAGNQIKAYINETLLPAVSDTVAEAGVRAEAEAQRVTNEAERVEAETQRAAAESIRVAAENERIEAEGLRDQREEDRVTHEIGREQSETARIREEWHRTEAETARQAAETDRAIAEADRAAAEGLRIADEDARETAEADRVSAESARATAETMRAFEEGVRQTSESARVVNETDRVLAEQQRGIAESERMAYEQGRNYAEQQRVQAETARVLAEDERQQGYAGVVQAAGEAEAWAHGNTGTRITGSPVWDAGEIQWNEDGECERAEDLSAGTDVWGRLEKDKTYVVVIDGKPWVGAAVSVAEPGLFGADVELSVGPLTLRYTDIGGTYRTSRMTTTDKTIREVKAYRRGEAPEDLDNAAKYATMAYKHYANAREAAEEGAKAGILEAMGDLQQVLELLLDGEELDE